MPVKKLKPKTQKQLEKTIKELKAELSKKSKTTKKKPSDINNILEIFVDVGHFARRLKGLIRLKTKYSGE
jgi:predicted nucleotide-binding protein (sugar kinase/HSP70/actin superfamily)